MVLPSLLTTAGSTPLPDDPQPWLQLSIAAACLVVAAVGAHASAALLIYSPTKLARLEKLKRRDARTESGVVAHLQACDQEYDLLSWGLALAGVGCALPLLTSMATSLGWTPLVFGGLFVLFLCAALPVALAVSRAEQIVLLTLPALRLARWLLHYPLLVPLMAITRWTLGVLRIPEAARTPEEIADEIMAAVTDSATENALHEEERNWIENIVELKDLRVSEAMTPRTDVVAFEAATELREAVLRAIETGHSRYPVYEGKVDKVVGVFYAKDALARLSNGSSPVEIREVMRKPLFVPESMGVSELLRTFKTTKLQMAIVLDEYGGTAGLISIEDILEEIVGDINDEFDADEEAAISVGEDKRVVELSGRARIDEVNEVLGWELPENPEYDTVAGYVFTRLGKIPKESETVEVDGIEFTILASDDRRIHRMRVTLPEPITSDSNEA